MREYKNFKPWATGFKNKKNNPSSRRAGPNARNQANKRMQAPQITWETNKAKKSKT